MVKSFLRWLVTEKPITLGDATPNCLPSVSPEPSPTFSVVPPSISATARATGGEPIPALDVRESVPRPTQHQGNLDHPGSNGIGKLESMFMWGNWGVNRRDLPHYLIPGRAEILEPLLEEVVSEVSRRSPESRIGWVWEAENTPRVSRALRVVDELRPGHKVAGDIHLYARHGDLYIRQDSIAWTKIKLVTRLCGTATMATLLVCTIGWLWHQNGFRTGWVKDIAKKYALSDSVGTSQSHSAGGSSTSTSETKTFVEPLTRLIFQGYRARQSDVNAQLLEAVMKHEQTLGPSWLRQFREYFELKKLELKAPSPGDLFFGSSSFREAMAEVGFMYQAAAAIESGNPGANSPETRKHRLAADFLLTFHFDSFLSSLPATVRAEAQRNIRYQLYPRDVLALMNDPNSQKSFLELLTAERDIPDFGGPCPEFNSWRTFVALVQADYLLFFVSVVKGPAGALIALWVLFIVAPKSLLKFPCLLFRWPMPQSFDNAVVTHNAALQAIVGGILLRSFRITDKDRIPVHTKR